MSCQMGPCGSAKPLGPFDSLADQSGDAGCNSSVGCLPSPSRWRELFPLPRCPLRPSSFGESSSSRRRRCRVNKLVTEANQVVDVLNEMYVPPPGRFSSSTFTMSQSRSHHEIFSQLSMMADSKDEGTAREAVEELLRCSPTYSSEELSTTVRTYEQSLVSIPTSESDPIELSGVLDECGRDTIEDPFRCMMLSEEEWGSVVEHGDVIKPYMDVKLQQSPEEYRHFVKKLYDVGMLRFTCSPQDLVTPFFVSKKDGRLRLILDCRGVNRRFRPPPTMSLAAGYTWSHLQLPRDKTLFIAQSDIKDYFYSLKMPEILQPFFSMPAIPSWLLRQWGVPADMGGEVDREGLAFPMLQVVPMGWSWAMWIAQRVHQHQCLVASGLSPDRVMTDRRPVPSLETDEPFVLPYADNLNVGGTSQSAVQELKDKIVQHLRSLGFKVHEELDATSLADSLGYRIDGARGIVQPVPKKLHKVRQCFKWLSQRPWVSGRAIEKILGHAVHFTLLRRELLSIFRNLYDFAARHSNSSGRLWRSAARESRWAYVLLRLCMSDLRKNWHADITASDASLSGIAVCLKHSTEEEVRKIGCQREGWRFSSYNPANRPREQTVKRGDAFSDPSTVKPLQQTHDDPFIFNNCFEEVQHDFMRPEDWQLQFASRMSIPEHITLLEGRGIVAALRHKFRSVDSYGKRHLHFNDNLAAVLIAEKGRSGSIEMLRVCRRIACLLIASGSFLSTRWIPSEWNPADAGSRRWEAERRADQGTRNHRKATKEAFLYPNRASSEGRRAAEAFLSRSFEQEPDFNSEGFETSSAGKGPIREANQKNTCLESTGAPASLSRANSLGADGSKSSCGPGLHGKIPRISSQSSCPWSKPTRPNELRRGLCWLSERHVSRRQRHQRSQQVIRSRTGCQPRLCPEAVFTQESSMSSRLVKTRPRKHPSSSVMGSGLPVSFGHGKRGQDSTCIGSRADVHMLPSTRGGSDAAGRGLGGTRWGFRQLYTQPSSLRPSGDIKSRIDGRNHLVGLSSVSKLGKNVSFAQSKTISAGARLCGSQKGLGPSVESRENSSRFHGAVPTSTLRAISRQTAQPTRPRRCEKAGEMELRQFNEAVRGSCKSPARISTSAYPDTGKSKAECQSLGKGAPKIYMPTPETDKKKWIIEVFSGTAHLSKAAAAQGYRALAIDVLYGSSCDVLNPEVQRYILRFAARHDTVLVWFGMPCQSWSRARKFDGGPQPLRDDDACLWGRAGLGKSDQQKVQLGNQLLLCSISLISQLHSRGIAWALENPWSSRAWLTQQVHALQNQSNVFLQRLDYCQYHMPWKKATGIMFSGVDLHPVFRICSGTKGRCNSTGKHHLILEGKDSDGKWLTHRAQPYPPQLCSELISQLSHASDKDHV